VAIFKRNCFTLSRFEIPGTLKIAAMIFGRNLQFVWKERVGEVTNGENTNKVDRETYSLTHSLHGGATSVNFGTKPRVGFKISSNPHIYDLHAADPLPTLQAGHGWPHIRLTYQYL
jgi:hypothetical protein